jgi:hypothetical protein
VWAYDTRDALDLSVEAAVAALPRQYHPATLRKVEGGSARPGTRMWRELGNLYSRIAAERGVAIDPQPKLKPEPVETLPADAALVSAIDRLTAQVARIVTRLEANAGAFDGLANSLLALLVQLTGTRAENGAASAPPLSERR